MYLQFEGVLAGNMYVFTGFASPLHPVSTCLVISKYNFHPFLCHHNFQVGLFTKMFLVVLFEFKQFLICPQRIMVKKGYFFNIGLEGGIDGVLKK